MILHNDVLYKSSQSTSQIVILFIFCFTDQCFTNIESPQSRLRKMISQECDSFKPIISQIDEPNLVCHKVHPSGPPPGYKRMEVYAPYPENAVTEEEASNHPFMKEVKKLIKEGKSKDVKVTLKCQYLRDLS